MQWITDHIRDELSRELSATSEAQLPEMDMGRVNPWVGLGWVQLKIDVFYSYVAGLFITYFLTTIPNKHNLLKMAQYLCAPICIRTTTVNSLT